MSDENNVNCKSVAVPLAYSVFDFNAEKTENVSPVVIVHCLLSNRKTWKYIATKLAKQTGRVVYTVDLRNHGESPHNEDGLMREHYSKDLEAFLQSRGIKKCCFIGHSLGGKIQLLIAFVKPELVESLILVDIIPSPTAELFVAHMVTISAALRNCIEDLSEIDISDLEEAKRLCELQLKLKVSPKSFRDTLVEELTKTENGYDWKFNNDILEQHYIKMIEFDSKDQCYKGPTLIIAPELSFIVTPSSLKEVSSVLPNMRCVRLPNVTHHLHMEAPGKFINLCVEFWSTI